MGTPVKCPDAGIILNGTFESSEFWQIENLWQIHNGYADSEGPELFLNHRLWQETNLVIGETYVIDFDVLEATFSPLYGLIVALGSPHGVTSGRIDTIGHKREILTYNGAGEWIEFYVLRAGGDYWYVKIDNIFTARLECFIACALSFANLPNTNFEWYDLGGGLYHVLYADTSGITKLLVKIDINDF